MLFAAGFGTRMKELTRDIPKPMIKVAGRSLIDHTLDLARGIDPDRIVANVHYKPEMLERHLTPQSILTIREEPDILETGGGLRAALPMLGEGPVFTANTDAIWLGPNPFQQLLKMWNSKEMDALLMCVPVENAVGYSGQGDFEVAQDGTVTRGTGVVYGGIQIVKTEGLHTIQDRVFSLNVLWNKMIENRKVHACLYPGKWCDVGHPAGVDLAEKMLRDQNV